MYKYYKLNKPAYEDMDYVRVSGEYNKDKGGYVVCVEFVHRTFGNMFGKMFCKEFFDIGGDGYYLLVPAARRNKKKETEAAEIFKEKAREFAEKYITRIEGLEIIEEDN